MLPSRASGFLKALEYNPLNLLRTFTTKLPAPRTEARYQPKVGNPSPNARSIVLFFY